MHSQTRGEHVVGCRPRKEIVKKTHAISLRIDSSRAWWNRTPFLSHNISDTAVSSIESADGHFESPCTVKETAQFNATSESIHLKPSFPSFPRHHSLTSSLPPKEPPQGRHQCLFHHICTKCQKSFIITPQFTVSADKMVPKILNQNFEYFRPIVGTAYANRI